MIKLSKEAEPQIWEASHRFGTILENVVLDPETREMKLDDMTYTENTRSSYPLSFIDNAIPSGQAGHPRNVVMLTADAYGAMPPIARLTPEGAMYHFLSGTLRESPAPSGASRSRRRPSAPVSARRSSRSIRMSTRRCSASGSRSTSACLAGEHRLDRWAVRCRDRG